MTRCKLLKVSFFCIFPPLFMIEHMYEGGRKGERERIPGLQPRRSRALVCMSSIFRTDQARNLNHDRHVRSTSFELCLTAVLYSPALRFLHHGLLLCALRKEGNLLSIWFFFFFLSFSFLHRNYRRISTKEQRQELVQILIPVIAEPQSMINHLYEFLKTIEDLLYS